MSCFFFDRFAFPWEVGMYWKFDIGGSNQRAMGCPGKLLYFIKGTEIKDVSKPSS